MKDMKILLIPGHGDGDPGAVGNGYKEADLTREVATMLSEKLSKYAEIEIFDFNKNMYTYLKSGKSYPFNKFNYVVEIHFNSHPNLEANGTEILVHSTEKGISVEESILDNLVELGFKDRGVDPRSDLLVMNTVKKKYGVSHALLEICFISNKSDIEKYINNKSKVIDAIVKGIVSGFNLTSSVDEDKELETVNDIVWELSNRGIITNKELWLKKLEEDRDSYWLARKCVNYIRKVES